MEAGREGEGSEEGREATEGMQGRRDMYGMKKASKTRKEGRDNLVEREKSSS